MVSLDRCLIDLLDMYLTNRNGKGGFIHPGHGLVVGVPPVSGEGYPLMHPVPPFFPVVVQRPDTHDNCCCCSQQTTPPVPSVLTDDLKSKIIAKLREIDDSIKFIPPSDPTLFRRLSLTKYVKKILGTTDIPSEVTSFINEKLQ
jgi:hypothetical protein